MPVHLSQNTQKVIKVGILTQPSRFEDKKYIDGYQYIVSSYVKYLEQDLSVQCVPIPFDASQGVLKFMFSQIDGLFFTGGMMNLQSDSAPLSFMEFNGKNVFLYAAKYLFELALEANKAGTYFPVWGTCQGFQLIQILVNNCQHDTLTPIDEELYQHNKIFDISKDSKIFNSIEPQLKNHMQNNGEIFYYHYWSVREQTYQKYEKLRNFFNITSYSENSKGDKFIASIEAKDFPIYGVQFHPEIPQFEKKLSNLNTPQNYQFGEQLAQFFISEIKEGMEKNNLNNKQRNNSNHAASNSKTTEIINLQQQSTKMPQQCFEEIVFYKNNDLLSKVEMETVSDLVQKVNIMGDDLIKRSGPKKKFKRTPKQIASVCVLNCIF